MEPLQPKPDWQPPREQGQPKRKAARRATTTDQPQVRRGASVSAKRIQAESQPRDQQGRFAKKGNWLTRLFDPPKPLAKLRKMNKRQASPKAAPKRRAKKKHKKPVPERGLLGRIGAVLNGDYARWRRADEAAAVSLLQQRRHAV